MIMIRSVIKQALCELNITQSELARRVNVSRSSMSQFLNRSKDINIDAIERILITLNINLSINNNMNDLDKLQRLISNYDYDINYLFDYEIDTRRRIKNVLIRKDEKINDIIENNNLNLVIRETNDEVYYCIYDLNNLEYEQLIKINDDSRLLAVYIDNKTLKYAGDAPVIPDQAKELGWIITPEDLKYYSPTTYNSISNNIMKYTRIVLVDPYNWDKRDTDMISVYLIN